MSSVVAEMGRWHLASTTALVFSVPIAVLLFHTLVRVAFVKLLHLVEYAASL
jgi:hypothetical protein